MTTRPRRQRFRNRILRGSFAPDPQVSRQKAAPVRLREERLTGAEIKAASGTGGTGVAASPRQRGPPKGVPKKVKGCGFFFQRAARRLFRWPRRGGAA